VQQGSTDDIPSGPLQLLSNYLRWKSYPLGGPWLRLLCERYRLRDVQSGRRTPAALCFPLQNQLTATSLSGHQLMLLTLSLRCLKNNGMGIRFIALCRHTGVQSQLREVPTRRLLIGLTSENLKMTTFFHCIHQELADRFARAASKRRFREFVLAGDSFRPVSKQQRWYARYSVCPCWFWHSELERIP
jgi:hypothetical protein